MSILTDCAASIFSAIPSDARQARRERVVAGITAIAPQLRSSDVIPCPESVLCDGRAVFFLIRFGRQKLLVSYVPKNAGVEHPPDVRESRDVENPEGAYTIYVCPCTNRAAFYLQGLFEHLVPRRNPGMAGFGTGDRLGLATPGHVRALAGSGFFPVFAQQSIREMERTGRTPADVIASAVWGVMQEGYAGEWGSDADHLRSVEDIEYVSGLPWTMFTLDPSGVTCDPSLLRDDEISLRYHALPWNSLQSSPEGLLQEYQGGAHRPGKDLAWISEALQRDESALVKCAVKYSAGISHCRNLMEAVGSSFSGSCEIEVSFDETDSPTSPLEHYFISSEFRRLGMRIDSLALRYPGAFEKGVDYKGNIAEFDTAFALHAAIRDEFDMYRLSIHSGSDKFSIYPIIGKYAGENLHIKTAGTSYLEALRLVARVDSELFREVLHFARTRYAEDRKTYHVSARTEALPGPGKTPDGELENLLDDNSCRQILHVTFGSVLTCAGEPGFAERIKHILQTREEEHSLLLRTHIRKHLGCLTTTHP